ncbi:bifunctional 3'-5' exonuclease/DNA polymerase [Meiothermus rufus]|uniref:bifunctional 3'-5' exonuclease/DNA polymerase n=1 Tax=Meiothermus rufus TaxID=604332 RepID=UPI0005655B43|nr:bifunctional 3'-5' exonuclease/DNA polymerase [Meiothermus rufus]
MQTTSNPAGLLETLAQRKATLERHGNTLRVSPKGVALGLEDAIRHHKPALLALLARSGGTLTPEELRLCSGLTKDYGLQPLLLALDAHLPINGIGEQAPQTPRAYTLVTEPHQLEGLLPRLMAAPVLGLDLETSGLDPHQDRPRLLSLSTERGAYLLDMLALPRALEALRPLFEATTGPVLVGHNLKFDLAFLLKAGLWPEGRRLWCTGLAHQVIHAQARMPALADLAPGLDKRLQTSDWSGPLSEAQLAYAAKDAQVLLPLYHQQQEESRRLGLVRVLEIESRALPAVAWMGLMGVPFDPERWLTAAREAELSAQEALKRLDWRTNWDSPRQVLEALRRAGLELSDTREETLSRYRTHPAVAALLAYREHRKRVGTYGPAWLENLHPLTGRIHPSWQQIGAESGRMSCSRPNLQQVPREPAYRACFRAPIGRLLVKADYSQIELRLAAQIAGEKRMLEAFEQGEDLHTLTARLITGKAEPSRGDRQLAKALNFGLLYGMGSEGLRTYARANYGLELSPQEAEALREAFFRAYPGLRAWHRRQPEGETEVRTLTGRRRVTSRHTERLNTPVQGSGADGLKLALALLWERRERLQGAFPVLAVHDEIVLEAPRDVVEGVALELVCCMKEAMQEVLNGRVPVEVEAGVYEDWGVTSWRQYAKET